MSRKPHVFDRFARHFLAYPQEYVEWYPTIPDVARAINVSSSRLKRALSGNPIPGISVYLGARLYRNRTLPAYRINVHDLQAATAYLQEYLRHGEEA